MVETDKYGKALGLWNITVAGANLDLVPEFEDFRKFRNILIKPENKQVRSKMMDEFDQFMIELIKRKYPEDSEEQIKNYVIPNEVQLFNEAMITFNQTTREELEKANKKQMEKLTDES